jgi:hypothetical protein
MAGVLGDVTQDLRKIDREQKQLMASPALQRDMGYPAHLARQYRQDPYTAAQRSGYTTQSLQREGNLENQNLMRVVNTVLKVAKGYNKQRVDPHPNLKQQFFVKQEFQPDIFGGHVIVRPMQRINGQESPVGPPFKIGVVDNNLTVGVVGSGSSHVIKSKHTDRELPDLEGMIMGALQKQFDTQGQRSVIQELNFSDSKRWNMIDPSLAYRSEAGRTKEVRSVRDYYDPGVTVPSDVEEAMAGVSAKGTRISFEALKQIPGYISEGDLLHLGEGGGLKKIMKAAAKRPKLHMREYSPFGARSGKPLPEARANLLWGSQQFGDTAVPLPGLFFSHHTLAEGQGFIDPKVARYIMERFEDKPEDYRIKIPRGMDERHIIKKLGLADPALLQEEARLKKMNLGSASLNRQRDAMLKNTRKQIIAGARSTEMMVGPGQKLTAYEGHGGHDIIDNFQRAIITGYSITEAMNKEGYSDQYMQLQGHRETSVGGGAALKYGGIKALAGHMRGLLSGEQTGFPVAFMGNAPSSSRQFMANVLNFMPREELESYWMSVHGEPLPDRISTVEGFDKANAVYQKYLDAHRVRVPMAQTMTGARLHQLSKAGRILSHRPIGKTTGGEHLHRAVMEQEAYLLPFGAKLVRESSNQQSVAFSFEEGEIFRDMGMGRLWDKMAREGKKYRQPYNALAEASLLNQGIDIRPENRIVDLEQLLQDREMAVELFTRKRENLESLTENIKKDQLGQQEYWMSKFNRTAGAKALEDMFGDDVIYKLGDQYISSPALMERFGYLDKDTNKQISALKQEAEEALWMAVSGISRAYHNPDGPQRKIGLGKMATAKEKFKELATRQAGILEGEGARKAWLSQRTKRGVESVYLSLDELGSNEVGFSYKAISDIFGLHKASVDWRTDEGRAEIDRLANAGELRVTGGRTPVADPTRQYGIVLNVVSPGIMKERGSAVDFGTSRTPYFNPLFAMAQGGDNDSDRARLAASTMVSRVGGNLTASNLFKTSTPGLIRTLAENHPAGEYQDYREKLGQGAMESKFRDFKGAYDQKTIEQFSQAESQALKAQTGTVYNLFRRILPHFADKRAVGKASAKYFQPLIDQKAYQEGEPMSDLVNFLSSFDPFTAKARGTEIQPGQDPFKQGQEYLESILARMGDANSEWAGAMPIILKGFAHANVLKNIRDFKSKAASPDFTKTNKDPAIKAYHEALTQNIDLLSAEDRAKFLEVQASHGNNSWALFRASLQQQEAAGRTLSPKQLQVLANMRKQRSDLTEAEIQAAQQLNIRNQQSIADLLEKIAPRLGVMEGTQDEFDVISGIMGAVARSGSPLRQSGQKLARGRRFQELNLTPKPAYTYEERKMVEEFDKPYQKPTKKEEEVLPFAEGGIMERPTVFGRTTDGRKMVGGEAGKEFIVPESKVQASGRGTLEFDPSTLGRGRDKGSRRYFAEGDIIDEEYYRAERLGMMKDDPTEAGARARGKYMEQFDSPQVQAMKAGLDALSRKLQTSGREYVDLETGEVNGGGVRAGSTVYKQTEIKSFTKPFTSKLEQQYAILAREMENYAAQIKTLYESGGTLKDTQGEFTDVLKSATATYHSVVEQNERARKTQIRFNLQQREADETITEREKSALQKFREGRPQDVTSVEAQIARRVYSSTERLLQPLRDPLTNKVGATEGSVYQMAAEIGARPVGARREDIQAEKHRFTLSRLDRGMMDIISRQVALDAGRRDRRGIDVDAQATATEIAGLAQQRRELYQQYVPRKRQYDEALAQGRMGEAKNIHKELDPLVTRMAELKDQISLLKPEVQEHVEALKNQTATIKERISEDEKIYANLKTRYDTLETQKQGKVGLARLAAASEQLPVREQMDEYNRRITGRKQALGAREAEIDQLQALLSTSAGGTPRSMGRQPQTIMDRMQGWFGRQFNPQRLFYESQALAQGYYMLGQPLARAREGFLSSEMSRGRMEFALGMGGVGPDIAAVQRQRATMGDFTIGVGKGVNEAVSPWVDWIGQKMAESEQFAPTLGKLGTYGVGLGTAGFLANKFGMFGLAQQGLGLLGSGSALGGAGLLAAPFIGGAAATGVYELARQNGFMNNVPLRGIMDFATMGAASPLMRMMGIDPRQFNQVDYSGQSVADTFGMYKDVAGFGLDTLVNAKVMGMRNPVGTALGWLGWGQGTNEEIARRWSGQPPIEEALSPEEKRYRESRDVLEARRGTREADLAKEITNIREDFKRELGGRVTVEQAGEIIREYAEVTGAGAKDIISGPARRNITNIAQMALDAGMEPEQLVKYIGQAPKAAGVGFRSPMTNQILEMFSGVRSISEIESLMSSMQAVSGSVQATGLFGNVTGITKTYDQIMRDKGQYQAQRYLSQITLGNAYDYSQQAYAAGTPELALMDQAEPWRPRYERETRQIEDRRRGEDLSRSFSYQQQEIDWAEQRLDLEEQFWDLRMDMREKDFGFQNRQHDLTMQQMQWNLDKQDEYARLQETNFKRNWEINLKLFDLQTQWREQDFDKQESRMETTRAWQVEDFGYKRETFEMQQGWQQEDMERSLRYATGRQRLDIKRQMERATIMANLQRSQMSREEGRAEQQYEWQKEDLATDRERWGIARPLQREQMEGSFEYQQQIMELQEQDREKQRAFAQEQMQLMSDRHKAWLENYERETPLLEDRHNLELEMALANLQRQKDSLQLAKARAVEDEKMLGWQRELQKAQQLYNATQQLGLATTKEWNRELAKMAEHLGSISRNMPDRPSSSSRPNQFGAHMMAEGGSTRRPTFAMLSEHGQEEYVVPSHGALVLKEGGSQTEEKMLNLLSVIANALQSGAKIVVDTEALKADGFLHVEDFDQGYK